MKETDEEWLLIIQSVQIGLSLDSIVESEQQQGWSVTPQAKFERLLRETQIPIGILFNGIEVRLVYAPRGESSGYLSFPIQAMTEVSGRLILGALYMLLSGNRLFNSPINSTLKTILTNSREYQAEVSTKLANQVLDAMWELLGGLQSANVSTGGNLLEEILNNKPQYIYAGLITVLMRLVFLLYTEDEGLMPNDSIYQQNYAVSGLYERLQDDYNNYSDTMNQRYGGWAWLLSLFRLVYDGGGYLPEYLPARHGQLFDPDEYPFLEGRKLETHFQQGEVLEIPRVSDGVIYRILNKLLILDGEMLSYRALDVEQIGSVYESIMGFEVEVAHGSSIAIKPKDIVVNVGAILAEKPTARVKKIEELAECKLSVKEKKELEDAKTIEQIVAGIANKISKRTPDLLPVGSLFLQPGQERRGSGSHYTPRKLTQPIVEKTLEPVFKGLGDKPTPEQILDIKVCDLAMGSGAFLVETCRQLAQKLLEAWIQYDRIREIPDDVEPLLAARRLVAQKCLYGVDKNPFAVNLAKLSVWLVTLAKDRPFTFVDHALKCGDSLIGFSASEIEEFGEIYTKDLPVLYSLKQIQQRVMDYRQDIQKEDPRTDAQAENKIIQLRNLDHELEFTRLIGDVIAASFFNGTSKKEREEIRKNYVVLITSWREGRIKTEEIKKISLMLRNGKPRVVPFFWELEFPEVFNRDNPGFDAIVGNPPFAGKNTLINGNPNGYLDWIKELHPESHGNSDLVAHFFRRAFNLIRKNGVFGLIATNTISQGDTRSSGLSFICNNHGTIYNAQKRLKWPGLAAVVVSVVNIYKGKYSGTKYLDGRSVNNISAFLFPKGGNENPKVLLSNSGKSFQGSIILGMGFTFDDSNPDATSIAEMNRLIEKDSRNAERIFPYIGGEEVNTSSTHAYHRYVINFGDMSEDEARQWPDLMAIVEEKVKPTRISLPPKNSWNKSVSEKWWLFGANRKDIKNAIAHLDRVLVTPRISKHSGFAFLSTKSVFSDSIVVLSLSNYSHFSVLQSHLHEIWSRFFGSSLGDGLRYTPSDCFETFPLPENWETSKQLEEVGKIYYEYRARLMINKNQGLTQTYNRFHDPYEADPEILKLRKLHSEMDEAVMAAYGWFDVDIKCGFVLDYVDVNTDDLSEGLREKVMSGDLFFQKPDDAISCDGEMREGKRKLPWNYKWNQSTHDEVLARLLDLNKKRYEEETLAGKNTKNKKEKKGSRQNKKGSTESLSVLPLSYDTT
ncbi:DNA methyltransferase [Cylindrospermopsis raciborskii]|uniref:Eco57I restriction-modification methylase domain-containing protein n=1 Tax=Cylindrospermopsis raciborskii TaxID=77022 RepID=UPI0022CCFEBC|nr:DNA methyltransferase [Cylindrospermopsis raciborskii]MCZ2207187.1 N-6 DNA methylase [Cylindrospermopsis raciborskii PAMP2011]